MQLLKSLFFISILVVVVSANENNETKDSFERASTNNHKGFMPRLITPDPLKSGIYGGLALSAGLVNYITNHDNDNTSLDLSLITGYNFNNYLATEGRATISIANDNKIDYKKLSLFLKPKYEVYDGLNVYSLIGIGKVDAKSVGSNETKSSKTSMQLGAGIDYKLENNFKLFADYTYLGNHKGAKFKNKPATLKSAALTAGISYDF